MYAGRSSFPHRGLQRALTLAGVCLQKEIVLSGRNKIVIGGINISANG
nr:MAG TPA: hypothetical protein [Caudoviricetes sp.]